MLTIEFIGGSLDGTHASVESLKPALRLPPAPGQKWSEVYELHPDGKYHFARHGVPPLLHLPEPAETIANAHLARIVEDLMPHLYRLENHFHQRGGYTELSLGPWRITRRDDVPADLISNPAATAPQLPHPPLNSPAPSHSQS